VSNAAIFFVILIVALFVSKWVMGKVKDEH